MEIVRQTFLDDGKDDLVTRLDQNDTQVINEFIKYPVMFKEEVKEDLYVQMYHRFLSDCNKIKNEYPDFKSIFEELDNKVKDPGGMFDIEIVSRLMMFSLNKSMTGDGFPFREEAERIIIYYRSLF